MRRERQRLASAIGSQRDEEVSHAPYGWQRIGLVSSALWIVVAGLWENSVQSSARGT